MQQTQRPKQVIASPLRSLLKTRVERQQPLSSTTHSVTSSNTQSLLTLAAAHSTKRLKSSHGQPLLSSQVKRKSARCQFNYSLRFLQPRKVSAITLRTIVVSTTPSTKRSSQFLSNVLRQRLLSKLYQSCHRQVREKTYSSQSSSSLSWSTSTFAHANYQPKCDLSVATLTEELSNGSLAVHRFTRKQ